MAATPWENDLTREHAVGSFRKLLHGMARDVAMLVWLDGNANRKRQPNENFAREVMELFSLDVGHYTENDIKEAARAFSGWDIQAGKAVFNESQHDATEKTFLGQKGNWQGADITRICLEQKVCALFVCRKLYRFLVSESLPATAELIEPLADQFRQFRVVVGEIEKAGRRSELLALKEHRCGGHQQQQRHHRTIAARRGPKTNPGAIPGILNLVVILDERDESRRRQIERRCTATLLLPGVVLSLEEIAVLHGRDQLLGRAKMIRVIGVVVSGQGHDGAVVEVVVPQTVKAVAAALR